MREGGGGCEGRRGEDVREGGCKEGRAGRREIGKKVGERKGGKCVLKFKYNIKNFTKN